MRGANHSHSPSDGEDLLSKQTERSRNARRAGDLFSLKTAVGDPSRTLESKQWRGFPSFFGNCGAVTFWVTAPPPKNPLRTANLSLESSANCRF
jgi:hypothetical protein